MSFLTKMFSKKPQAPIPTVQDFAVGDHVWQQEPYSSYRFHKRVIIINGNKIYVIPQSDVHKNKVHPEEVPVRYLTKMSPLEVEREEAREAEEKKTIEKRMAQHAVEEANRAANPEKYNDPYIWEGYRDLYKNRGGNRKHKSHRRSSRRRGTRRRGTR